RLNGVSAVKRPRSYYMDKQINRSNQGVLLRPIKATFISGLLPSLVLLFSLQTSQAGSAAWSTSPTTGDWNTAANWTPATVPNGPADVATFAVSNNTGVSILAFTEVDSIVFNP